MWNFLKGKRCYLVVLGGFLIELSLGSFYSVETIDPFFINFMNKTSMSRRYVNAGNTAWILGLLAFGVGAAVSAGGILAETIGSSMTVLIGGWIMSLNVALTYYTINTYISVVAISYGLLSGIGTGLSYGVAFGTPCKWFPKNTGLIIGIVLSGFAISSAVFSFVQNAIIKIGSTIQLNYFPISFIVLGLIYSFLQFLGSLLMKDKSEDNEEVPIANSFSSSFTRLPTISEDSKCAYSEQIEIKTHQLFLEFDFWILWWTMFINFSSLMMYQHLCLKIGRYYYQNEDTPFVILSTIGSISNALGRICWGLLIDRKSYKLVMVLLVLPLAVFLSTFPALLKINNPLVFYCVYIFWTAVTNALLSGNLVVFPAMCAKLYGMKHFISNYGVLFTSCSVTGIMATAIVSSYSDTQNETIIINGFIISGVILLISVGLTFLFRGKSLVFHRV